MYIGTLQITNFAEVCAVVHLSRGEGDTTIHSVPGVM